MNDIKLFVLALLCSMSIATTANSVFASTNLCTYTSICQNDGNKVQIQGTDLGNTVRFRIINLDSKEVIGTYIVLQDNELMRCHNGTDIKVSESESIAINKLGSGPHNYTLQITLNDGSVYSQEIWVQ